MVSQRRAFLLGAAAALVAGPVVAEAIPLPDAGRMPYAQGWETGIDYVILDGDLNVISRSRMTIEMQGELRSYRSEPISDETLDLFKRVMAERPAS